MKDETYVFIQDNKEKKAIARSSRHRRSHAGKGGSIRFPSDHLTKKELQAMNGEMKTYRMNDPITWKEFKTMPDDLKASYVEAIREKFCVPDKCIAEMMGVNRFTFSDEMVRLEINRGSHGKGKRMWDKDGFYAWCKGVEEPVTTEEKPVETVEAAEEETICEIFPGIVELSGDVPVAEPEPLPIIPIRTKAVPESGSMLFKGTADEILASIGDLLGDVKVRINVSWEVLPEERA